MHPSHLSRPGPAPHAFWERRDFVLALVLLSIVPLLWPDVPPLRRPARPYGPLPGPARARRLARPRSNITASDWALIGNLGVDLLVELLAPLIGLEPAVKLIVLAIPALTVGGLLWVAYEVHGRVPPTALFALPFAYNFPFLFGFVNFALAMALALPRLRPVAAAGAARPAAAARRLVRADLDPALGRPRLRLGHAGRARLLGRAGPPASTKRPQLHRRRLPRRPPLPVAGPADRS